MNRFQFWTLNFLGFVLAILLLAHYFWGRSNETVLLANEQLNQTLAREQATISAAQQVESVLGLLAKRIARGSETDPQLRNILARHALNVTLETDGTKRNYP